MKNCERSRSGHAVTERPSRPDGRGLDLCGLLSCLLEDDALGKIAREREIDVERLRQCVKHHCSSYCLSGFPEPRRAPASHATRQRIRPARAGVSAAMRSQLAEARPHAVLRNKSGSQSAVTQTVTSRSAQARRLRDEALTRAVFNEAAVVFARAPAGLWPAAEELGTQYPDVHSPRGLAESVERSSMRRSFGLRRSREGGARPSRSDADNAGLCGAVPDGEPALGSRPSWQGYPRNWIGRWGPPRRPPRRPHIRHPCARARVEPQP